MLVHPGSLLLAAAMTLIIVSYTPMCRPYESSDEFESRLCTKLVSLLSCYKFPLKVDALEVGLEPLNDPRLLCHL